MTNPSSSSPRDNFDAGSLSWVMGEIREALSRSKNSVFEAVSQDEESRATSLRQAKTFLHQAHGALQIVDIDGVSIITETTEDLLDRLESGQIELTRQVAQIVENAYQALIEYLEELLAGAPHQPVRLFPYYKTLLEVRGAERIHPADLFFPNLAIRPQLPPIDAAAFSDAIDYAALRQRFERALLPFLKKNDPASETANSRAMLEIVAQVERTQSNQQSRAFWWVLHTFAEAVAAGQIRKEIYVKQLFARINLQIRRLSEGSYSIAERLLRDALFFIARIEQPSPRAAQVRKAYQLDGLVPVDYDKKRYGQVDPDALAMAKSRLNQAKNLWNRIAAGDLSVADSFGAELKGLTEASAKLGSPALLKLLRELNGIARHAAANSQAGSMLGLEMATGLLFVENAITNINRLSDDFPQRADAMTARLLAVVAGDMPTESASWLDEMSREAQERQTMATLAGEMMNSLRQVEKQLDDFFREPTERAGLSQIDPVMHQIAGALAILDQDDALRAVEHTRQAVRNFVEAEGESDVAAFQHVAQNVGALSFFIETLQLQPENAKQRFSFDEKLGMFRANLIERNENPQPSEEDNVVVIPELPDDGNVPPPPTVKTPALPTVEQELELRQQQTAELARSLSQQPDNAELQEQLKENLEQVQLDAALVDNQEAGDRAQAAIEMLQTPGFVSTQEAWAEIVPEFAPAPIEAAPAPAPATPPPPPVAAASDEEVDAELLEIFLGEAVEVLECIATTIPLSRQETQNQEHLTTLRRSFHTLKGSGRMVGLTAFGEGAWGIEQVLNVKLAEGQSGTPDLYALLDKAHDVMSVWVEDLQAHGKSNRTPDAMVAAADRVKQGQPFSYEEVEPPAVEAAPESAEEAAPESLNIDLEAIQPIEHVPAQMPPLEEIVAVDLPQEPAPEEPASFEPVFEPVAEEVHPHDQPLDVEFTESLHAEVQQEEPIAAVPVETPQFDDAPTIDITIDVSMDAPAFEAPQPAPVAEVIEFPSMQTAQSTRDDHVKRIGDLEISVPLHNIYMAETDELVRMLANDVAEWRHEPERPVNILSVHAAHSLAGSSATVGFVSLQEVAHALEMTLQCLSRKPISLSEDEFDILQYSVDRLKTMLQTFALAEMPEHEPEVVRLLARMQQSIEARAVAMERAQLEGGSGTVDALLAGSLDDLQPAAEAAPLAEDVPSIEQAEPPAIQDEPMLSAELAEPVEAPPAEPMAAEEIPAPVEPLIEAAGQMPEPEPELEPEPAPEPEPQPEPEFVAAPQPVQAEAPTPVSDKAVDSVIPDAGLNIKDELDADLLPVFLEEGRDMLPDIGEKLRAWQQNPVDIGLPQGLLRLLHTVKGSARMAGAMQLGQHMHEMETRIESVMRAGAPSAMALDDLMSRYDYGSQLFEVLQNPNAARPVAPYGAAPAEEAAPESAAPEQASTGPVELTSIVPLRAGNFASAAPSPTPRQVATPTAQSPLVRVRADILDRLVNQAGEVSISRSKLETEVDVLRASLSELTENVSRLRTQLREIEMQAESQISSRMSQTGDDFDPLEFDRFTRLQELTRMMAESVNDVGSVQQNLSRTVDSASDDLITQARLTRDLQQDLMRVRMVQFASVSERLFRVTRQAAKELDKRVNLDIRGSNVEMDRSVLEKMVGPFEHLLRNAIVHGIESKDKRRAAGKSEIGELLVEIRQEGNEVVIQFADDGQGLNVERIKAKAQSAGLLSEDMSESEISDLIFHPGFSTADAVTELAGRGVGMDVVRSEAAALGGRVSTKSDTGKGTTFTIHLPLTLAVTQVVLLSTGGRTFAVPSVLVEQVQQLKVNTLTAAYNEGSVIWQGQRVSMYYLSTLLGDKEATAVAQQYTPLVIMKSGEDRVALHVDQVIGNREVVVKNIGPQLARLIGVAGATVLGSGDIVLIINPVPLAQRAQHESVRAPRMASSDAPEAMGAVAEMVQPQQPAPPQSEAVQGLRTQHIVMVVDDSLTVRRVTQRLLQREGYQVVLAKDGVDALEQLQSITPDVMLVDIEMPRMDGFDLTRNVRGDERTRHIPIIMITSRTASKHRNYAMELGVNEYLGKPYQEEDLLRHIAGFIGKETPVN